MPGHLLAISKYSEDLELGKVLAAKNDLIFNSAESRNKVRRILVHHPESFILWDAESKSSYENIGEILPKYVNSKKVIAISSKPLNHYPHLFQYPAFSHHLIRKFGESSLQIYSQLPRMIQAADPFGLKLQFPKNTPIKKLFIKRSVHKSAAIEAIQNYLMKENILGRVAALIAQAMDELIINAIFDAPTDPKGTPYRWESSRNNNFELNEQETIHVEIAATDHYMAVCVTDQFGSLRRDTVLNSLGRYYRKQQHSPSFGRETDVGFGLRGIYEAGLSLIFIIQSDKRAQIVLFFQKTKNYKEFKTSFRFLSIIEA